MWSVTCLQLCCSPFEGHIMKQPFVCAAAGFLFLLPLRTVYAGDGNESTATLKPSLISFRADLDGSAALPSTSENASGEVLATYDTSRTR
jgi:hypothetical protein